MVTKTTGMARAWSTLIVGLGLLVAMQASGQPAPVLQQSLSLGAYYAAGDYGEADETEIRYVPFTYEANRGKWGVQLLLPWLQVTGLGNVLVNVGGVTRAVAGTQRQRSSGMGDAIASVVYRMDPVAERAPFIDLRLDVKLPTADESKSLGTGETDYSFQVDLSQNVGNSVVFATIGRNFRGKSTLFPGLQDASYLQLGFARPWLDRGNIGVFYDYREAASNFSEESHELVPYLTWQLSEHWSVTGLATWGFTDASANYSVMGQLSYRW